MEAINGVTFEDWGAACGNIAQGMTAEEVCEILGLELPVWQKTTSIHSIRTWRRCGFYIRRIRFKPS